MNFIRRLLRLMRQPPREIVRRVVAYGFRRFREFRLSVRDRLFDTFPARHDVPRASLARLIAPISPEALASWRRTLLEQSLRDCRHEFDLLGSGLVKIDKTLRPIGLEGHRYEGTHSAISRVNRKRVQNLRRSISAAYSPIDWHMDFRSGYRWQEDIPSFRVTYGILPGVDVKLPWELARMQHAPRFALTFSQFRMTGDLASASRIQREFQDQVLDFLAANPPRFGVNWVCTMDVAIRIVNWLVAYDLFRGFGAQFPADFEHEFKSAVIAHGRHIVNNLEWLPHLRSNHYLSNIAGLLFVAAYLPESPESNAWLALAANELGKEIFSQFHDDGSNFEGSTSYHRLSAEMVVFSVSLAYRICRRLEHLDISSALLHLQHSGPGPLPNQVNVEAAHKLTDPSVLRLVAKMARFTIATTRPDGRVVQIGDNDSGHFLDFISGECDIETAKARVPSNDLPEMLAASIGSDHRSLDALFLRGLIDTPVHRYDDSLDALWQPVPPPGLDVFPDFGLYIYRKPDLWLSVRCGSVGQRGNGGHAHNDQLSLEVSFRGVPFVVDPGSYVYTPLPDWRNAFRSTSSHATLAASPGEQNTWLSGRMGLFSMSRVSNAKVINVKPDCFVGEHDGFDMQHRREVEVGETYIRVTDSCEADQRVLTLPLAPNVRARKLSPELWLLDAGGTMAAFRIATGDVEVIPTHFSIAYGKKEQSLAIRVKALPPICRWELFLV